MKIKNNKQDADSWTGQLIQPGDYYSTSSLERSRWANDSKVLTDIGSGSLLINDETNDITDVAQAIQYLRDELTKEVKISDSPTFSSKNIGAKKLFSRLTGKVFSVVVGVNTLDFSIPFNSMKMNGLEIVNAKAGETVNLKVLDTPAGLISGYPNVVLNQFGFSVVMPEGFYSQTSNYDADIIKDLVIRLEYTAKEARDLGINYLIHEVK